MSETVHYKGKIKKVEIPKDQTINEYCKELCKQFEIVESDYFLEYGKGDYIALLTEYREDYICVNGGVYEVLSKEYHDLDEGIARLEENNDGTYDYDVRYYNGGAGFDEMIEQCFDNFYDKPW